MNLIHTEKWITSWGPTNLIILYNYELCGDHPLINLVFSFYCVNIYHWPLSTVNIIKGTHTTHFNW